MSKETLKDWIEVNKNELWLLKRMLHNKAVAYYNLLDRDGLDCGFQLKAYFRPELIILKRDINLLLGALSKIDPACPKKLL